MGKFFDEFGDLGLIFQPVPKIAHEAGCVGGFHPVCEIIIDPETIFFIIDKARFFQYLQMLGHTGLGDPEYFLNLADTHELMLEHLNDPDPIRIGQGLHYFDEIFHNDHLKYSYMGI